MPSPRNDAPTRASRRTGGESGLPPAPPEAGGPAGPRLRGSLADRLEVLVPLIGYAIAVVSGASWSSLGSAMLRQDPTHPLGVILGSPRPIRSDEWLTQAPIELGMLSNGTPNVTPLAQDPDLIYQLTSGSPFESILFADANLLRLGAWLPDAWLFAAYRALPLLLMLLALPPLLRRLGAVRTMSWFATLMCVFAPASVWWSFMPVRILGYAAAGCYLLVLAKDRWVAGSRVPATALAAVAGILLARLTTYYVPWCLTIGVPLVLAVGVWLILSTPRRAGWVVLGIGAAFGAIVLAGTVWENLDALRSELNTAYPGLRRSTGTPVSPFLLLGAPGLNELRNSPAPLIGNASEDSSAWTICAFWAALLWSFMGSGLDQARRVALRVLAGAVALWLAWSMVSWGALGERLPLLNFVPSARSAQTVGYPATILLAIVLSQVREARRAQAWTAAAFCGLLTAYGVSDLQRAIGTLWSGTVWAISLLSAALVFLITRRPLRVAPMLAAVVAAALAGATVNPIVFGLADLRDSSTAQVMTDLASAARADGTTFIADSPATNALLVSSGVPSITGYQVTGPKREVWQILDPTGAYELQWNRGASYVRADLSAPPGSAPSVTNPNPDIIMIRLDPCGTAAADLRIGHVVAQAPIQGSCLRLERTVQWAGSDQLIYAVDRR